MQGTFTKSKAIDSVRKRYMKGVIGDRFLCNLKHVSLEKLYDLVIARWCLCYLEDEDLGPFLTRCNRELIKGRPGSKPGIMIVQEQLMDSGEDNKVDGE